MPVLIGIVNVDDVKIASNDQVSFLIRSGGQLFALLELDLQLSRLVPQTVQLVFLGLQGNIIRLLDHLQFFQLALDLRNLNVAVGNTLAQACCLGLSSSHAGA